MSENRELKFITKSLKTLISLSARKPSDDCDTSKIYSTQFNKFQDCKIERQPSPDPKFMNIKTDVLNEELFEKLSLTTFATYNFEKSHSRIKICDKRQYIIDLSIWFQESMKSLYEKHPQISPMKVFKFSEEIFSFVLSKIIEILGIYCEDGKILFKNLWNNHLGIVVEAMDYIEKRQLKLETEHIKEIARIHKNYQYHLDMMEKKFLDYIANQNKPSSSDVMTDTTDLLVFSKRRSIYNLNEESEDDSFKDSSNSEKSGELLDLHKAQLIEDLKKQELEEKIQYEEKACQTIPIITQIKQIQTNEILKVDAQNQIKPKNLRRSLKKVPSKKPTNLNSKEISPDASPRIRKNNKKKSEIFRTMSRKFSKNSNFLQKPDNFESSSFNSSQEDIDTSELKELNQINLVKDPPSNFRLKNGEESYYTTSNRSNGIKSQEKVDFANTGSNPKFTMTQRRSSMKPPTITGLKYTDDYLSMGNNSPSNSKDFEFNKLRGDKRSFSKILKMKSERKKSDQNESSNTNSLKEIQKGYSMTRLYSRDENNKGSADINLILPERKNSKNDSSIKLKKIFSNTSDKNISNHPVKSSNNFNSKERSQDSNPSSIPSYMEIEEIQNKTFAKALKKIKVKYESPDEALIKRTESSRISLSQTSRRQSSKEKPQKPDLKTYYKGSSTARDKSQFTKEEEYKGRPKIKNNFSIDPELFESLKSKFTNGATISKKLENLNESVHIDKISEIVKLMILGLNENINSKNSVSSEPSLNNSEDKEIESPKKKSNFSKLSANNPPNIRFSVPRLSNRDNSKLPSIHPKIYEDHEEEEEEHELRKRIRTEGNLISKKSMIVGSKTLNFEKNYFYDKTFTTFRNIPKFLNRKKTPFSTVYTSKVLENTKVSLSIINASLEKKPYQALKRQAFIKQFNSIISEACKLSKKGKFQILPMSIILYQVFISQFGLSKVASNKMMGFILTAFADNFPLSIILLKLLGIKKSSHMLISMSEEFNEIADFDEDPLELQFIGDFIELGKGNINLINFQFYQEDYNEFIQSEASHFDNKIFKTHLTNEISFKNTYMIIEDLLMARREEKKKRIEKIQNILSALDYSESDRFNIEFIIFIFLGFSPIINQSLLIEYYFEFTRMYGLEYITIEVIASWSISMKIKDLSNNTEITILKRDFEKLKLLGKEILNSIELSSYYMIKAHERFSECKNDLLLQPLIHFSKMNRFNKIVFSFIPDNLLEISKTFEILFIDACNS